MSGNTDVDKLLALISQAAKSAVREYQKCGQDVPSLTPPVVHPLDNATDQLELRMALRQLEGACHHLYDMLAPPAEYVAKNSLNYAPVFMRTVVEAGIADILGSHPEGVHISRIAEATSLPQAKLTQVMRALVTRNCFFEVDTDMYANNRISHILRRDSDSHACDNVWLVARECSYGLDDYWEYLKDPQYGPSDVPEKSLWSYARKDVVGEGGNTPYEWWSKHPELMKRVNNAMITLEQVDASNTTIHVIPWKNGSTLCDIGSGVGSFTLRLAKLRPDMDLTLQDHPTVMEEALQHWSKEIPKSVQDKRVAFVPLDFITQPPVPGKDYYFMRAVLHNWPDNDVRKILANLRKAMTPHSRLLIQEYLLAQINREGGSKEAARYGLQQAPKPLLPNFGWGASRKHNIDFAMQVVFNAKERTTRELIELGTSAGLRFVKLWDLGPAAVLEFGVAINDESLQSRL